MEAAIRKGRKLTEYLIGTIEELHDAMRPIMRGSSQQKSQIFHLFDRYTDTNGADLAEKAFRTISKAIGSLVVSGNAIRQSSNLQTRAVDIGVASRGLQIPFKLVHQQRPNTYFEATFNVIDGVISVMRVGSDIPRTEESPIHLERNYGLGGLIAGVFLKLHTGRNTATKPEREAMAASVRAGTLMPEIPLRAINGWLPASLVNYQNIEPALTGPPGWTWLNYIPLHVSSEHQAYSVIQRCLRGSRVTDDVTTIVWEARQVYHIGHWPFYALLGSDLGQEIAWLLLRHKSPEHHLGQKAIKSITIFHSDWSSDLLEETARLYYTPVLLFEIVNVTAEVVTMRDHLEMAWTHWPNSPFHSWFAERSARSQYGSVLKIDARSAQWLDKWMGRRLPLGTWALHRALVYRSV